MKNRAAGKPALAMNGLCVNQLRFMQRGPYTFSVPSATVFGLSGSSGSGKTLLLRAVCDLDESSGEVTLDGVSSKTLSAPEWRRRVAWLPAESHWWYETVGAHFWKQPESNWLKTMGFGEEVLRWEISRLSTGEKQRLAILRLLQHEPRALLLDEPTASLDKNNMKTVESFLLEYIRQKNGLAIWVSHDSEQLERVAVCHYALLLGGEMRQLR